MPRSSSAVVSRRELTGAGTQNFLTALSQVAKVVPIPGLAAALEAVEAIWSALEAVRNNKKAFAALAKKIRTTAEAIFNACEEKAGEQGALDRLARQVAAYVDVLAEIQWLVQAHIKRSWLRRLFSRYSDSPKIAGYEAQLQMAHETFMTSSMIGIGHSVSRVEEAVTGASLTRKLGGAKVTGETVHYTKIEGGQTITTDNSIDNRSDCGNTKTFIYGPTPNASIPGLPANMSHIPGVPQSALISMNPNWPMHSTSMLDHKQSSMSANQLARIRLGY
ncbi:hypothetical protein HGRIS_005461 [Hohenbuehelia grisea]|uniref:NACHT-NTPase and P-loop NTPases N-terminal domain-containing protein n=1 Tax=Hohenbuehelia grisea TaxID=104357 RepID=A0ABR3JZ52_9AGAR